MKWLKKKEWKVWDQTKLLEIITISLEHDVCVHYPAKSVFQKINFIYRSQDYRRRLSYTM